MASKTPISATSSFLVLRTVEWCTKHGFKPVAIAKGSKAAISRDYALPGYTPPALDFWKGNDYGVGVVTGPQANGPIDVDLDCEEAIYAAQFFLPSTPAVFGRKSKLRSHYLYRTSETEVLKRAITDPSSDKLITICELRADGGHQTVLPGTVHASGETVEWSKEAYPDIPVVEMEALDRGVRKTAIFTLIARHLWMEGQRNEVTKHLAGLFFYLDWPQEEAEEMIDHVCDWMDDDDKTRLITVRNTYKKALAGGKVTGAGALIKFTGNPALVDRIRSLAGSQEAGVIQEYNERFGQVLVEGAYRIAMLDASPGEPIVFLTKGDFENFTQSETVTVSDKRIPKAKLWAMSERSLRFKSIEFLPGQEDTGDVLNLWTGWPLVPNSKASCSAFLELVHDVICGGDEEANLWLLTWLANILREPLSKPLTAPVVISEEHGAGKSLAFTYYGRILGNYYVPITDETHLVGRFNAHMGTCLFLHSEEALYSGDKKHKGLYQSLITDDFRMFERKGIDAIRVRNFVRLALTSNENKAAPVQTKDRRFCIFDMGDRKASPELIKRVLAEMEGAGPAALLHHLQTMAYDGQIVRTPLKNQALAEAKNYNATPLEAWWLEKLLSGELFGPDISSWGQKPETEDWPVKVPSGLLFEEFQDWLKHRPGARPLVNLQEFCAKILNFLHIKVMTKGKVSYDITKRADEARPFVKMYGPRINSWTSFPSLDEARAGWEEYRKLESGQIEWPGPGEKLPWEAGGVKSTKKHERY